MSIKRSKSSTKRKSRVKSRRKSRVKSRRKSRRKSRVKSRRKSRRKSRVKSRRKSRRKHRSRGGVGRVVDLLQVDRHLRSRLPDLPADQINVQMLQDQVSFHIEALKDYANMRAQTGQELTIDDKIIVRSHTRAGKNIAQILQKQKVLNVGSYHTLTSYLNTLERQALQTEAQEKLARRTRYVNQGY
jgi:superfamily II DNA helicase RecQ